MNRVPFDGNVYTAVSALGPMRSIGQGSMWTEILTKLPPAGASNGPAHIQGRFIGGQMHVAGQGHDDGQAWHWNGIDWKALCDSYGTSVAAFGTHEVYVSTPGNIIRIFDATTRIEIGSDFQLIGVEGIARITDNGQIHARKDFYGRSGFGFFTEFEDGVQIGQGAQGGLAARSGRGEPLRLIEDGDWQFINVDRLGDIFGIGGTNFPTHRAPGRIISLDEIRRLPIYTGVVDVDPKPVPVPPKPVPVPEVKMKLPDNVKSAVIRFVTRWTVPQIMQGELTDPFENRMRAYVMKMAEYVRFVTADTRWGTKDAGGGRPPSKDSIAFNGPDGLTGWDMFNGTGTGKPTLIADPDGELLPGQHFISVQPFDHVGGVIDGGGSGGNTPGTGDLDSLRLEVATLKAEIAGLKEVVMRYGDRFGLRTDNGHLICAEGGGGGEVNATRTKLDGWESYRAERKS